MDEWKNKFEEFIETASHDLQSPLRKLSVMVERLVEKNKDAFDEASQNLVTRITGCVSEMKLLVDNLTSLAQSGDKNLQFSDCDLNAIVSKIINDLQEENADIKLDFETGPLPTIKGDGVQYKQLFSNILENAVKFRKKDVPLKVKVDAEKEGENYRLIIADNGIGFKPEYAEKIFEPFVRLHAKSQYPGSGLGLAICKKIVANHRGTIYAEGNIDEGSRFILLLPINP